jgi:integrase
MARKRSFASIEQLPSKRWRVRYTGPDGAIHKGPNTFATALQAEAYAISVRRKIDRDRWDATDDNPPEQITFGAYAARWLESRQVAGRPIKARTREHYQGILEDHLLDTFGPRQLTAIKPKDVRGWYADTLTDRPTMRSHATACFAPSSAPRSTTRSSTPIRAGSSALGGPSGSTRSGRPVSPNLAVLTEAMLERLRLMVTLASWCALRFGEIVELRRGDIDLSAEVIRIRRAAVRAKGTYTTTTPKSDAGIRDVAIPPHIIPAIERHMAKYVGGKRDSLIFPADNGRHLQSSDAVSALVQSSRQSGPARPEVPRPQTFRCRAGRSDRRITRRTDGPPGSLDTASGDALSTRRGGPRPRNRGAAVQAGRGMTQITI